MRVQLRWGVVAWIVAVGGAGCGGFMTRMAADSTVDIVEKANASFDRESDLWLARQAGFANLKFVEGLLEATPGNTKLMVILARSYGLLAFAFLEDDLEQLEWGTPEYDTMRARTLEFYNRCRKYAVLRLSVDFPDVHQALRAATDDRLDQILAELDPEDHLAATYWLAFAWGAMIQLQVDEPDAVADLPRVKKLMAWVRQHDPGFENAGPVLFFGMVETALPAQLGGHPEKAREAFEEAIRRTDGKYLLAKALYARAYMRAVGDRAGYERLLREVLDAPEDLWPAQRLATEVAKVRARRWLAQIDEYFDPPGEGGDAGRGTESEGTKEATP